ncbi:winged helix-turn-helix transcriptional regulator [Paenibacillus cremeus]|uniref:Helix-turn-helix transcriptional regulator n=1 Tax=Paenibacillus cremeus TaxID=2163881 RepID=A0A559KE03_9BACL|nr:helix-turn-helix domain-containing protein [Paenibacillus cremeus]TVY10343.1 helix-turn-helix transcriptional regulator [Paenibacillus cremeus]
MGEQGCEITQTIQLLSKRWTIFLLDKLLVGPQRFSEIGCQLSISGRLLSERLKELEAVGLVKRTIYPEMPVRVEYALTDKGKAFKPILDEIKKWVEDWADPEQKSCCPGGAEHTECAEVLDTSKV